MKMDQQAFPVARGWTGYGYDGMSLRDYFAAAALQGMCSNLGAFQQCEDHKDKSTMESVCETSYRFADKMLKEREKPDAKE